MIASPARGWPWVRQNNVSRLRLASGETEQCLPFEVALGRDITASLVRAYHQARLGLDKILVAHELA
jgi:hypothetical protein